MLKVEIDQGRIKSYESAGGIKDIVAELCLVVAYQYALFNQKAPGLAQVYRHMMLHGLSKDGPVWEARPVSGICIVTEGKKGSQS